MDADQFTPCVTMMTRRGARVPRDGGGVRRHVHHISLMLSKAVRDWGHASGPFFGIRRMGFVTGFGIGVRRVFLERGRGSCLGLDNLVGR